ncbi:MAG: LysM peptidoglycan-binding domain-containing protein [Methylocystis sp.]|uniref:LysM peptidoglycan-binding domain-containing protein n=1 Tax=Methylocystis sp. TaxID=1911079 RepID=UPI003DA3B7C6
MAYAVVHGIDPIVDRPQTARECLELIKILQARAEPIIRILDANSAEIRLGELERRQRREVEQTYVAALAPATSGALPVAGVINRAPIAGALAILAAAVLFVGALWRYEHTGTRQTIEAKSAATREAAPASAPYMKTPMNTPEAPAKHPGEQARGEGVYTVVAGDTLGGIARKAYHDAGRWRDIVAANPHLDPSRLRPGETINLPHPGKVAIPR